MSVARSILRLRPRRGWNARDGVWLLALVTLAVVATSESWLDIFRIATRDEESSHALLVPVVAAWMIWMRRGRLRHCRPAAHWIGPAMILLGGVLFALGESYWVQLPWHVGAVVVVVGACFTVLGRDVFVAMLPVVLVLAFLVPVPRWARQRIAIPLQEATAAVTQNVCEIAGMDVNRTGNVLRVNGMDVAIAEACNGMRMMFALFLVCFAFAFTTPLRLYVRVLIVVLSPVSAVLCNVIRLWPTLWAFGHFDPATAARVHLLGGWVMLLVSFLLLLGVLRFLRWVSAPVAPFRFAHD